MSSKKRVIIGIYKITNKVNNKAYIGQSIDIHQRWNKHKSNSFNENSESYNSTIGYAIRKYGVTNFAFEIIEKCCVELLDEREIHWISYYDTYHNGYNETLGGQSGRKEPDERTIGIMHDLANTQLTFLKISQKWDVSVKTVDSINAGRTWYSNERTYPIRKTKLQQKKNTKNTKKTIYFCPLCGKEMACGAKLCLECYNKERASRIPLKDKLLYLILRYPLTQIAKMYNVSSKSVEKWCKKYNLPYKQNQIKKLRDEYNVGEWYGRVNNDAAKKPVIRYNLNNEYLAMYTSIREAGHAIVVECGNKHKLENIEIGFSGCCKNKYKTAYGCKWKYAE